MEARRIGCLWIPHVLIWLTRRARPESTSRPLVIGGTPAEPRRPVLDCCEAAQAAGVRLGMVIREAQAPCPDAIFLSVEEAAVAVQERLLGLLERFSPDVESVRPGVALFDATRPAVSDLGEEAPVRAVVAAVDAELGTPAHASVRVSPRPMPSRCW